MEWHIQNTERVFGISSFAKINKSPKIYILILFSDYLLLLYRTIIDFSILTLNTDILLKLFTSSYPPRVDYLGFLHTKSYHLQINIYFFFSNLDGFYLFFLPKCIKFSPLLFISEYQFLLHFQRMTFCRYRILYL